MTTVVDANVVVKWFVAETGRPEALELLQTETALAAPDLVVPEVANIAWKKVLRNEIGAEHARFIVAGLAGTGLDLSPPADDCDRALEIALALGHPAYDCFYIALAERLGTTLVTADRRLCSVAEGTPFAEFVRPLVR